MAEKSLQKLTKPQIKRKPKSINLIMKNILGNPNFNAKEIKTWSSVDRNTFKNELNNYVQSLPLQDQDRVFAKIEYILDKDFKNLIWQRNHSLIQRSISLCLQKNNRLPGTNEIEEETGLSRQTIAKHLAEFSIDPRFKNELNTFRYMTTKLLASLFTLGIHGDVKASRLYIETVNRSESKPIGIQNNFIQINNTRIELNALPEEARKQIEEIVRGINTEIVVDKS